LSEYPRGIYFHASPHPLPCRRESNYLQNCFNRSVKGLLCSVVVQRLHDTAHLHHRRPSAHEDSDIACLYYLLPACTRIKGAFDVEGYTPFASRGNRKRNRYKLLGLCRKCPISLCFFMNMPNGAMYAGCSFCILPMEACTSLKDRLCLP